MTKKQLEILCCSSCGNTERIIRKVAYSDGVPISLHFFT